VRLVYPGGYVPEDAEVPSARAKELGERLADLRRQLGLKRPAFVREMERHGVQISADYLGKLEYGARSLENASPEIREAIRSVLGLTREEWQAQFGLYLPAPRANLNDVLSITRASGFDRGGRVAPDTVTERDWLDAPVFSFASASLVVTTHEEPTVIAYRPVSPEHFNRGKQLFRVVGRSMEPTIQEGWDIVVDLYNLKLDDNAVILLAVPNGDVAVKRVRLIGGEPWLYSDNPAPEFHPRKVEDGMVVRGRVLGAYPPYVRLN
jgi:phage repressor protein C with HTH and peptisase S24 domain